MIKIDPVTWVRILQPSLEVLANDFTRCGRRPLTRLRWRAVTASKPRVMPRPAQSIPASASNCCCVRSTPMIHSTLRSLPFLLLQATVSVRA